jgi:hypothetical protein
MSVAKRRAVSIPADAHHEIINVDSNDSWPEPPVPPPPRDERLKRTLENISTAARVQLRPVHSRDNRRHRAVYVDSTQLCFEASVQFRERNITYLETLNPRDQAEIDGDARFRRYQSSGDEIMKEIRMALESFGMTRTFLQMCMHDLALNVMGSLIYRAEWETHRARILEANDWRDYPPIMAAICARRFGKTVGAAQLASAAMIAIPSCPVGCFAPTLRQATMIMQTTWSLLSKSTLFRRFRVARIRATQIVIIGEDGTERSLTAYPSTHKVRAVCVGGAPARFNRVAGSRR